MKNTFMPNTLSL